MVFALETYCAASDGRSAARIEEEVIVTPTGPQRDHPFPRATSCSSPGRTTCAAPTSSSTRRPAAVELEERARGDRERSNRRGSSASSSTARCSSSAASRTASSACSSAARSTARPISTRGQEAVAVGFASALRDGDRVACTYRGHGHALAIGTDPGALLAELLGRATGVNGGRAGSMNIDRPGARPDGLLRDRRRQHRRRDRRGARAPRFGKRRGRVLRRRGDEPGVFLRVPELRQGARPARRLRLREQRLRRVHAVRAVTAGGIQPRAAAMGLPTTQVDGMDVWAVRERPAR